MFARRPKFDDTFGVRMDLGADRKDPLSQRPLSQPAGQRTRSPVLVEETRSIFGGSRRRDPLTDTRAKPRPAAAAGAVLDAPRMPAVSRERFQRIETAALGVWKRLSVQQRIWMSVIAGWFLLTTGMFIPAIVVAGIYIAMRSRAA